MCSSTRGVTFPFPSPPFLSKVRRGRLAPCVVPAPIRTKDVEGQPPPLLCIRFLFFQCRSTQQFVTSLCNESASVRRRKARVVHLVPFNPAWWTVGHPLLLLSVPFDLRGRVDPCASTSSAVQRKGEGRSLPSASGPVRRKEGHLNDEVGNLDSRAPCPFCNVVAF